MIHEKGTSRYLIGFICAFILFALIRNGTYFIEATHERPYYFYMISQLGCFLLVSCWMLTVQSRIIEAKIRRLMLCVGGLFLVFFTMQMVKYCVFTEDMLVGKYMWYGYYIPMTLIPLLALYIIRYLVDSDDESSSGKWKLLWIPALLICVGFLTNDIHQLAFYIPNWKENGDKGRELRPIYFIYIAFMALLFILGLLSVIKMKNKPRGKKRLLYPAIPLFIGIGYIAIYTIKPEWVSITKKKGFFEIAEAFAFMMIGFLETCVQVGLIPANIGYGKLFSLTKIPSYVADDDGKIVYETLGAQNGIAESEDHRIVATKVTGGNLFYDLDLTTLNRLNLKLNETTNSIESRNALLHHENEIKAEREKTDIAIQIYDNISEIVRPWLLEIQELLSHEGDDEEFRNTLMRISVLNAYVKRRSNMELEDKKNGRLSFEELVTAITESLEYIKLSGMETYISFSGKGNCPSKQIVNAYLAFERLAEAMFGKADYMTVRVTLDDTVNMRFMISGKEKLPDLNDLKVEGCTIEVIEEGNDCDVSICVAKGGDE